MLKDLNHLPAAVPGQWTMEETLCSIPLTAFGWHRIRLGMMTQIPIMNAILNEETEAGMNEEVGGFSSH
ncbi:MAG: hypothetical protein CMJ77_14975 [Planctomycetaceae bacterium]|nr:hypothetical protein [Planctomycetaceae bacterium]